MAFLHVNQPSGTGFFIFPIDAENLQSRIPHDFTRVYPLAPFERGVTPRGWQRLKDGVGAGKLTVVGIYPDDAVTKKWDLIVGGETCFFVTKDELVAAGTIIHAERSRALAEALFGKGSPGSHELLILLAAVETLSMPIATFYEAIGRKIRAPFKGFTTMSLESVRRIEEKFGSMYGFLEAAKAKSS